MAGNEVEDTPVRARVTIEAGSSEDLDVRWLNQVRLPRASRVDYRETDARGDVVVTRAGQDLAAVFDLTSGEFVTNRPLGRDDPSSELLVGLLRSRLRHVAQGLPADRVQEGRLGSLAELTGGFWYAYKTLLSY